MVNIKKIDDKDLVFINKPLTDKEEKEFSEFLKARKASLTTKRKTRTQIQTPYPSQF